MLEVIALEFWKFKEELLFKLNCLFKEIVFLNMIEELFKFVVIFVELKLIVLLKLR